MKSKKVASALLAASVVATAVPAVAVQAAVTPAETAAKTALAKAEASLSQADWNAAVTAANKIADKNIKAWYLQKLFVVQRLVAAKNIRATVDNLKTTGKVLDTTAQANLAKTFESEATKVNSFVGLNDGLKNQILNVYFEEVKRVNAVNVVEAKATAGTLTDAELAAEKAAVAKLVNTALRTELTTKLNAVKIVKEVKVEGVSAVAAKSLKVTFNQAVDTTKAVVKVTKNGFTVNQSAAVAFAADKTSATISLSAKMSAGDYKVTVSGLSTADLTGTVTVKDETITKVELLSDNAVITRGTSDKTLTVAYKVTNQYGEDMTSSATNLTLTTGKGQAVPNTTTGVITIDNTGTGTLAAPKTNTAYALGDKITLSIVDAASGTFVSKVLTVAQLSQVSNISISKLHNANGATLQVGGTEPTGNFLLVIDAVDQYGNPITTAADVIADTIVTVSNPAVVSVAGGASTPSITTTTIDNATRVVLPLAGGLTAGTSTVTMISKTTGKMATYAITVKDSVKVDTLQLTTPEIAVAGESVVIPFTAVDQYGQAVTNATVLTAGMTSLTSSSGSVSFVQDYVKGTGNLVLNATGIAAAGNVVITGVTGTGKVVQFTVALQAPAVPTIVSGTQNFIANLAKTGNVDLDAADIIVKDQYNRVKPVTLGAGAGKYIFEVTSSAPTVVSTDATYIQAAGGNVTLAGLLKGSSTISVKLVNWTDDGDSTVETGETAEVVGSTYTFTSKVAEKADIVSYELADFDKLYDVSSTTHDVALTVTGVLADGTKVVVPQLGYYVVDENDTELSYSAGYLDSVTGYSWAADQYERTVPVYVTVDGATTTTVLTKNVTISKVAPYINTLALKDAGTIGNGLKEAAGLVSVNVANADTQTEINAIAADIVEAKDQYGKVIPTSFASVRVTNLGTRDLTAAGANKLVAGDSYTVTALTANGKSISFKVVLK